MSTPLRDRFAGLTPRLVLTTILLTAVVAVAVGIATTLALKSTLTDQLDDEVGSLAARAGGPDHATPEPPPEAASIDECADRFVGGNQAPGTLAARVYDDLTASDGVVLTEAFCGQEHLSVDDLDALDEVPTDGEPHTVDVDGFGTYRVVATPMENGGTLVTGLPTEPVDSAVASLVLAELLIGLLAITAAGAAAALVVRRQLRPLREVAATAHEVATLPLAEGEVDLGGRVPASLRDERTEVGQVGAALDTLLAHVDTSIAARHRSEQQVRQFVADASHELRTPLATIAGYAELARRRPADAEAARTALAKVEAESGRMRRLVEDLLTLARLDAGRPLASEPVDLTRLLLEAVTDAQVLAPAHHWRLDLPSDALEVTGDAHGLHQVVTNLLTNARRYTPAGTTVTVAARGTDEGVEVRVHDDGPGFGPGIADTAFDRFVRGDTARTRGSVVAEANSAGGSGLGLALVRAIVEAHGGTVGLESEPGSTTLTLVLPR